MWPRTAIGMMMLVAAAGCGAGLDAGGGTIRTDSAGVEIVESGPEDRPLDWRLDEVFSIGGEDDGPAAFYQVSGSQVDVDPSGRIYVLDVQSHRVSVFEPDGTPVRTIGREGGGPGELASPAALRLERDGTLAVLDFGKEAFVRFAPDGAVLDQRPVDLASFGGSWHYGPDAAFRMGARPSPTCGRSGTCRTNWCWPAHTGTRGSRWRRVQGHVVRHDVRAGEGSDTVLAFDYRQQGTPGETPNPFRPRGWAAQTGDAILTLQGDRAEVLRFDLGGAPAQIVRWREEPTTATEEDWEAYAEWFRAVADPMVYGPADVAEALDRSRTAASGPLPFAAGLRGDDAGRAWVGEHTADERRVSRYRVFSEDGRFLGVVVMPPRFQVLDIAEDLVLGVHRDGLQMETIELYRLPL